MRPSSWWIVQASLWILAIALVGPPWRDPEAQKKDERPKPAPAWRVPVRAEGPESAPVRLADGQAWIGANDFARLLDATKFWRADVRKLVLRARGHRIQLAADNPFVLVDDRTVRLPVAVRSVHGELQVPVTLLPELPRDSTLARLLYDAPRQSVLQVPRSGLTRAPRFAFEPSATRLSFDADRAEEMAVISRSRAHFVVHFSGFFIGTLPDSLPESSLVRSIHAVATATGTGLELALAPRAEGFRIARDPEEGKVSLQFLATPGANLESFAPEGPPGPRRLRLVAIDAGHGGSDAGVTVGGTVEKDLTLSLAKLLRTEIARRLAARVVLIREDDRPLTVDQRAEIANRAHADLVLSLHFDGFGGASARGATAYCPPATYGSSPGRFEAAGSELDVLPWRDVAIRHAVPSRELAEDILSALDLRALGPTRLRELLPYTLLGVNAPGVLLECATLTSEHDRARLLRGSGLADLATAIVDGLETFQASE